MAFGKLFTAPNNPRTTAIRAVAKANNIDLEIVEVDTTAPPPELSAANPLAKVPTFVGADGYTLSECIAIAIYITSQNEKTTLLGATKQDYASILKWMSFFNSEVLSPMGSWYRPLLGKIQYNKKAVEEASKVALKAVSVVEEHLLNNTFLVGDRITLADLFAAGIIARGFEFFFAKDWRAQNPNVSRWYETVYNQPIYSTVAPEFTLLGDSPKLTNVAPKQAEKPKKEAPKASKAAPEPDTEEVPQEAPKATHPLEGLPKAKFALDEWKRHYSNNETSGALKWFWENVPSSEYSIWKVTYKYNDELTMTFMSNNLIGGFNTRLEGSRKYIFGVACVFGEPNASAIEGVFVIRGEEFEPVFDVAPDYESYDFVKLDWTSEADRALLESHWSDLPSPITVNGKEYSYAADTGKVFK